MLGAWDAVGEVIGGCAEGRGRAGQGSMSDNTALITVINLS